MWRLISIFKEIGIKPIQAFFQGFDLRRCIFFFLSFQLNDFGFGILNEPLVAEFFVHRFEKTSPII